MLDLKECPFCGGKLELINVGQNQYSIRCKKCKHTTKPFSDVDCLPGYAVEIEKANNRAEHKEITFSGIIYTYTGILVLLLLFIFVLLGVCISRTAL
jgi:hypothetical protein